MTVNTIRDASQQILEAIAARRHRETEDRRLVVPIRVVDGLIADLEELNLSGRQRVPETWEERLEPLRVALPERFREGLRTRVAVSRLMDHLYDIEEYLFHLKVGDRAIDDDEVALPVTSVPTADYPRAS